MTTLLCSRTLFVRSAPVLVPRWGRSLSTSAAWRHGESQSTDPEYEIEKLKQASLQRQKQGDGEWMANLASDSEEAIKADKHSPSAKDALKHTKESFQADVSGKKKDK
ncbi:hypothetical protein SEPCBS119000_002998 [Sporothrix epigloea]|uniref:Mitochondrial carrier protein n=1 Tax=Sporothrix epigloea TaxID=1892477 RepID=A0ABP0DJ74_9PEZI